MAATIRFTPPAGVGPETLPPTLRRLVADGRSGMLTLRTGNPLADVGVLADWALERGIDLPDLDVRRPTLEDVYLALTDGAEEA